MPWSTGTCLQINKDLTVWDISESCKIQMTGSMPSNCQYEVCSSCSSSIQIDQVGQQLCFCGPRFEGSEPARVNLTRNSISDLNTFCHQFLLPWEHASTCASAINARNFAKCKRGKFEGIEPVDLHFNICYLMSNRLARGRATTLEHQ